MADGLDFRKLQSPEFAARERKRTRSAGLFGIGMGLVVLVLGINSMRTGKWVQYGRENSSLELPGLVVVLIALFVIAVSGAVIWRFARKA